MSGTAVDHWVFFRDSENAGVAAAGELGAYDVHCNAMVLVRSEHDDAVYRCPKSISFGLMSTQPFVPWPSYTEGRSAQLKGRLDALKRTAKDASQFTK